MMLEKNWKKRRNKSQTTVIGSIIIFSMFLIGIIVFYNTINKKMTENAKVLELTKVKSKAIEISSVLNDVIKYKSEKIIVWDLNDEQFLINGFFNFSLLNIKTNIIEKLPEEVIAGDKAYREICLIDENNNNALIGCLLEGYYLDNLSNFCVEKNSVYYCENNKIYVVIEKDGKKFLVTPLPSPKLNLMSNNLCSAYLVYFRGYERVIFVCDFYYKNGLCYFPTFKGSFVAYNADKTPTKVVISYDGTKEMSFSPYPFCLKSYKIFISLKKYE
jgi:hypothetical protein